MNIKKAVAAITSATLLSSPFAHAGEIQWNGFMSVVAGKTLDTGAEYIADEVTKGTYTDELLFSPESMMALQAQSSITDKLRATVQVVAHGADSFVPSVEWAFLSYDLTESFTVNAGRIRLPLYFYSDFLDVGYTYHWVRPPMDVYAIPQSGLEGVSLRYSGYIADTVEISAEAWYGASDVDIPPTSDDIENVVPFRVRDDIGISTVLSWEWFQLRLMYNELEATTADTRPLGGGDITLGQLFDVTYKSAAFMVDYENIIFRSEVTKLDNSVITDAGYASVGYQIGSFRPHMTYSYKDEELNFTTFLPQKDSSITLGLNWNFSPSAVLKLEYVKRTVETEKVLAFNPLTNELTTEPFEYKIPMFAVGVDLIF